MIAQHLQDIETTFRRLPVEEQRWLLERLTIGVSAENGKDLDQELAAMARDPDIQREIREIEREFSGTEEDGLENI